MTPTLAGKVALVTGAASGIGAATAALLRQNGAQVLATDRNAGGDVFSHDVTSEADWDAAIAECVARHGRLDILVSCAGTVDAGPIVDLDLETLRQQTRVHLEAAFIGSQRAVAQMRRQAAPAAEPATGSIIFIASIAGIKPIMQTTTYGTVKAALINLARALGVELGRKGDLIRVNAIAPGGTRTAMTETLLGGEQYWADPASFAKIPLRDYARPDDIARGVLFLASDDSEFITSQVLIIDGGWVLSA